MAKLNLGCGRKHKPGYINIDISPKCNPDYVWDVNRLPYPKEWTQDVSRIELDNLAEHIPADKFIEVLNEFHHIMKPGGVLWIRVPLCREDNMMAAFSDPTHVNFFTEQTFGYFCKDGVRWSRFGRDYGIIPWTTHKQKITLPFLEIWLTK